MRIALIILGILALLTCGVVAIGAAFFITRTETQLAPPPTLPPVVDGLATPTLAATRPPAPPTAAPIGGAPGGPFAGTFSGTLTGSNGSLAPATLVLTQDGPSVSGQITVGEGLSVDAGSCGGAAVPAGAQNAAGQVDAADPNHLLATSNFDVQGIVVTVQLDARVVDAQNLSASALIDLPFLCGVDPVIGGSFTRVQE
jgi:hypothetical protein